ncbi:hypothetical protein [Propionivibrio sp.]|nr:hypothetical protein [Propionivibrio sp.]
MKSHLALAAVTACLASSPLAAAEFSCAPLQAALYTAKAPVAG